MIKKTTLVILGSMLFTYSLNSNALAENPKHKAVIKKVKNQVEFKYEDNSWEPVKINQIIFPVTSIKTGPSSRAEIMFSDGTITRVGSKTFFTLIDKQNRAVNVQSGSIWFNVKKKSHGLKIYSSSAMASITGTEGFVEFSGNMSQENEIYIVKTGDTLTNISRKFIGKNATGVEIKKFIEEILVLNPNLVKNKNLVYQGDKLVINKTTKINLDKSDSSFSLGLIEGTSDVFKTSENGEPTGDVQKVKEGELLTLKGGNFSVQNLDSLLKTPKDMVVVRGGSFQMGGNGESDEKPIHEVNISSFYIGKYEVTQAEYKSIMGVNSSNFIGDELPVENVSWWDAIKYCNKKSLSEKLPVAYNENTGELLDIDGNVTKDITEVIGYRLPTEAEWEYASKGANKSGNYTYSGSNSIQDVAWYGYEESDKTTHKVGAKNPNEIGVFDMSGNVSEWVYDSYVSDAYKNNTNNTNPYFTLTKPDSYRVFRGGSWDYIDMYHRVFTRSGYIPEHKAENIGFRIAKNISF
jgi:formylglycine-generating enzyme required for sulfatase activity